MSSKECPKSDSPRLSVGNEEVRGQTGDDHRLHKHKKSHDKRLHRRQTDNGWLSITVFVSDEVEFVKLVRARVKMVQD